jgi:Zn-dependent protease
MDFDIQRILYTLPAVLAGLGLHEWAHAFTAWKLGDVTAKAEGRVSFNPLRHLDPVGLVFIVLLGFGWAKPVRFNPENLSHPRRDRALIAAAGPAANLLLGLAVLLFLKLAFDFAFEKMLSLPPKVLTASLRFLFSAASVNLGLFVFNMLPLPPLDGSHIFFSGIQMQPRTEKRVLQFGALALLLIILAENRTGINIIPIHIFIDKVFGVFGFA